jgi:hypothetical protein
MPGMGGGMAGMGGGMGGMGGGIGGGVFGLTSDPTSPTGASALTRGKVITTSGSEIIGMIHIPSDFGLELDFGSLTLTALKLRSITFDVNQPKEKQAAAEPAVSRTHDAARGPASDAGSQTPRYMQNGRSLIVISPAGDRVTLYNLDTRKSEPLTLSGTKEAPLEVTPILGVNIVALMIKGSKVTRLAVGDTASGTWHPQDLRKPIDGQVTPIVGQTIVVYTVGQDVYAYGAESQRWDLAEIPEGVPATPTVAADSATIESNGHIYMFSGKTGKWNHIDVRTILDATGAEKK